MKKPLVIISIILAAVVLIWAGHFAWRNLRGAGPALRSPPKDIAQAPEAPSGAGTPPLLEPSSSGLKLPPGFTISVFAVHVPGARVLAEDPEGTLLVSLTRQGKVVALPDKNADGVADDVVTVLQGLKNPHGLAFKKNIKDAKKPEEKPRLYVAETGQVAVYDYNPEHLKAANQKKIIDLPPGGRHFTRTLLFLPPPQAQRLLISVGSNCNVCEEKDWRYAKILVADADGDNLETYASGLRNSVFMARHPLTKHIWATEMGRDYLGDNLPPDEINLIMHGENYGWPWCYGKRVHDEQFDPSGSRRGFCQDTIPAFIDIPAHSSPLGLAFFPKSWPQEFRYNLLVAFHGSWNRSEPTGYKVVRYKLDAAGNPMDAQDFITGWLTSHGALGRPVDILIKDDGTIFISDDKAGVVYRVIYE
ncbi:MAG: PQQ-dependent sugar dehydrogenase [Desulfobaccales bacterium]